MEELYQAHIRDESFEHTVQPKMVYISNPTELGTIYTRSELENLYEVCRKYGLYLFVDGARLAYAWLQRGMTWTLSPWRRHVTYSTSEEPRRGHFSGRLWSY